MNNYTSSEKNKLREELESLVKKLDLVVKRKFENRINVISVYHKKLIGVQYEFKITEKDNIILEPRYGNEEQWTYTVLKSIINSTDEEVVDKLFPDITDTKVHYNMDELLKELKNRNYFSMPQKKLGNLEVGVGWIKD